MWDALIVIVIVAVTAGWLAWRYWRQLSGKGSGCGCGCGCSDEPAGPCGQCGSRAGDQTDKP